MEDTIMDLDTPNGISFDKNENNLSIEWYWYTPKAVSKLMTSIILSVIFLSIVVDMFPVMGSLSGIILLGIFPLAFGATAIALLYTSIAAYFNKTVIEVNHKTLKVWSTPLPFSFKKEVESNSIQQIYCKEVLDKVKPAGVNSKRKTYSVFELRLILKNRQNILLINRLTHREQALFIEKELESYLGIKNIPVQGGVNTVDD